MSFSEITKKIAKSLGGLFSSQGNQRKSAAFRPRRLHMDALEERQLLTLNTVMPYELTLTDPIANTSQTMSSNRFYINGYDSHLGADYTESVWGTNYLAANNQGDTVIVWAQNDFVYKMNPDGSYVTDEYGNKILATDRFGNVYDDYNIYARYLTDQVERLTLPEELLTDNIAGTDGTFKLIYAPFEVQRLSISTVTDLSGYTYSGTGQNVRMRFYIGGADTDGDGSPDFRPVTFDETTPAENAKAIQTALNDMGNIYVNATVTYESTKEYLITFNYEAGYNIPELEVKDVVVDSGLYVGVLTSTVSEPIVLSTIDSYGNDQGIRVDPNNPQTTAERIQLAFNEWGKSYYTYPRVENYTKIYSNNPEMSSQPSSKIFLTPEVDVNVVDERTFDITFINGSGLSNQQIVLVSAKDEFGMEYVGISEDYSIKTIKQSSDIFRVNAPEANDPLTGMPLVTNQINPSVAMDADGDFVITWESEAATTSSSTITNIYARQFTPQAFLQDDSKISFYNDGYTTKRIFPDGENTPIQGVRPVGDEFLVNSFSNNYLTDPAVGMDRDGNFVVTWSSIYQFSGSGSGIYAKQYDRYGNALTDAFLVSQGDVDYPLMHSTVAISDDGYLAIGWIHNTDTNSQSVWTHGNLYVSVYAPGSSTPMFGWDKRVIVFDAFNPSIDFDAQNQMLITYTDHHPESNINKGPNNMEMADVMARTYQLGPDPDSETGIITYLQTRGPFRIHSLGVYYYDTTIHASNYWRSNQYNGIGKFDADGDIVFIYQGYGPDSSLTTYSGLGISIPGSYFLPYLNDTKNSDLLDYFNPSREDFSSMLVVNGTISSATTDVDTAIRNYLLRAIERNATPDEVARLNAVLEKVVGQMRGGANDIFTTRINTGDWKNTGTTLYVDPVSSDANITSTRDGVNTRYYIMIPNYVENGISGGGITIGLYNELSTTGSQHIAFTMTNNVFNPTAYRNAIYQVFNSIDGNGNYAGNGLSGILAPGFLAANILSVPAAEVIYYAPGGYEGFYDGTIWEIDSESGSDNINGYHIYEIILVGAAHDGLYEMYYANGTTMSRHNLQGNHAGDLRSYYSHPGYKGTEQSTPGLAVQPNGSYVASWFTHITTTDGTVVDRKINYRYFHETSDNVGPKVTDVILPNGQYVANNSMVSYSLDSIVVTFDEQLLANGTSGLNSVLNPNNWVIMKDGVAMNGIIKDIKFGMNKAMDMIEDGSDLADSILAYGSNKWEAIITFTTPLGSGNYELVATNKLTDTSGVRYENGKVIYNAGNALGSNGTNPNGGSFSRVFSINAIDGVLSFGNTPGVAYDDKLVSDTSGEHYTRPGYEVDTPSNPTSVASDDQGNFVTVWTAEGSGIWAKIYHQSFVDNGNGRESVITVYREFLVTNNPMASYASVAMDADGDFVVTWMQEDADGTNIYAKAFLANGMPRSDSNGNETSEFRVNSHSNGSHCYPDIAVDSNGGFVITWESLNQVGKNSGYDIYFQRYDSACTPLGGTDEIQAIQFVGNPSAGSVFRIEFEGQETADIEIGINTTITAKNIKAALLGIGLDVDVEAASSEMIYVQFKGKWGSRDVIPMTIPTSSIKLQDPKAGQVITNATVTNGASGESRANDTTTGDQRYSSIAIAESGEVIISWTSWGQGQDSAYETNIYAKHFPANEAVMSQMSHVTLAQRVKVLTEHKDHEKLITSADSPSNHETTSNEHTGVVMITIFDDNGEPLWMGSGSLLTSGMHILTAAHVVCDDFGGRVPAGNIAVTFELPTGRITYGVTENYVHASYTGNYTRDVDLAILTLADLAPLGAESYDIYRGSDEIGSVFTTVGYGTAGTGLTGSVLPSGTKREGSNKFEALGTIFNSTYNPNTLVYDFDSGNVQNDALGYYFGLHDLGLGASLESSSAGGDSGGPSFVGGKIAGVVSYGGPMYALSITDVSPGTDSSFGEFSVDVRVSAYADWIDSIVSTGTTEYLVNQTQTGDQIWSDVAISMTGEVVFTWTSFNQDGIGAGPGGMSDGLAGVYARRFTLGGAPVSAVIGGDIVQDEEGNVYYVGGIQVGDEFLVNDYIAGDQYYSSISMSHSGNFMITWESYRDTHQITTLLPDTGYGLGGTITETITDFGIYAKRFTSLTTLLSSRDNTNTSQYGLPSNTRYVAGYGYVGIHGEIGNEFRVNKEHYAGDQTGATVTLNANGDAIIVFQGNTGEEGAETKVYYRAVPLSVDNTGPIVTDTTVIVSKPELNDDGSQKYDEDGNPLVGDPMLLPIRDGAVIYGSVTQMVVTFSEEMYQAYKHDLNSILNPLNWQLLKSGVSLYGAIVDNIQFGKNQLYNSLGGTNAALKLDNWEAIITFDSDITALGEQALKTGDYTLVIRDPVTDLDENQLDGDYNGLTGGNFTRVFQVVAPAKLTEDEDDGKDQSEGPGEIDDTVFVNAEFGNDGPAIVTADDGSFVVVAVHRGVIGTPNEPMLSGYTFDEETGIQTVYPGNIVMQRYDKNGVKIGTTQIVNNYMTGNQTNPEIAMDSYGNMAIVWSGYGETTNTGIYCRIYDQYGVAIVDQFQVNANNLAICTEPNVAYDENGNIIVTWLEYNPSTKSTSIAARIYDSKGVLQNVSLNGANNTTGQLTLVAENLRDVSEYDIAFDISGNLVITWQMHNPNTTSQDIYAKVMTYAKTGANAGQMTTKVATFLVNQYTSLNQVRPSVAASDNGTFVITWASERQDGSGYGVFARRFDMNGQALTILDTTGDAQINVYSVEMQHYPSVSMAPNGNFVITWTSYDQEPDNYNPDPLVMASAHDNGVFARAFNSNGKDLVADYTPYTSTKEFRLNNTTLGQQQYSVVAMNNDGFSFAWVGDVISSVILGVDENGEYVGITFITTDVYTRTYRTKIDTTSVLSDDHKNFSTYSYSQRTTGGGYAGQSLSAQKIENPNSTTLFVEGTTGNDVFEVIVNESGAFQVKVNGVFKTVGSNVTDIRFDGLDGKDKIIVTTAQDGNAAILNADDQRLSLTTIGGKTISAYQFEDIELNVAGANNMINVVAAGNDQLTLRSQKLDLSGDGYYYVANGFDFVSAISGSYTSRALLYDTAGDDSLVMSYGKAVMKGQGYEHSVTGFGNVAAYSSRGNDTAFLEGSGKDDSVYVSANVVSITTGGLVNSAKGFEQNYIVGNGGKDSATILGSNLADRFTGTLNYSEMVYGTGSYVGLYGFSNFNVSGNGGYDFVSLTDVAQNTTAGTSGNTKVYDSLLQSYRISDFNEVRLIQEATDAVNAMTAAAVQSAATLSFEDEALLSLIAAEHGSSQNGDSEDLVNGDEFDIDYLLKTGAL